MGLNIGKSFLGFFIQIKFFGFFWTKLIFFEGILYNFKNLRAELMFKF